MPDCECRMVPPLEVHSFTGHAQMQLDCDVNSHPNFKHWVYVRNHRAYDLEVYVSATVLEPYLVRFGDCPTYEFPDQAHVRDHFWEGSVVLEPDDEYIFGVFLFPDAKGGTRQQQKIDIYVGTRDHPDDSVERPYSNHIFVTA